MTNLHLWQSFLEKGKTQLQQGQKINEYHSHIQLLIEPSFSNWIFLQLNWTDETVHWYRTTWEKTLDVLKFYDPIGSLAYIGKTIEPTIVYEKGEIPFTDISHIVACIRNLSLAPCIDKSGRIILDGCLHTLTIGVEYEMTSYRWNVAPEGWGELQEIANLLLELEEKL